MFALDRDTHKAYRSVMVEKVVKDSHKHLSDINPYDIKSYDTVEVTFGETKTIGIIAGWGWRGGHKIKNIEEIYGVMHKNTIIVGYSTVNLIIGNRLQYIRATCMCSISDNPRKNVFVFAKPCRMVLVEKNIVGAYEEGWIDYKKSVSHLILGG